MEPGSNARHAARSVLQAADRAWAGLTLRDRSDSPALLAFAFHHLFTDQHEVDAGRVDPHQPLLLGDLERFIEYLLQQDYAFVTARQVAAGLPAGKRYALMTFDDGYRSALAVVELLKRYRVPAAFYIPTSHVEERRRFWWDVLCHERRRRGVSFTAIRCEKEALLQKSSADAERHVRSEFGDEAFRGSDFDTGSPMTPAELQSMAREPLVEIGNHTADHAQLTMLDEADIDAQIARCQQYLTDLTGAAPESIAYPNGVCDARVERAARANGLRIGLTIVPRKTRLPIHAGREMLVGRFCLSAERAIVEQIRACRNDVQFLNGFRRLRSSVAP